MSILELRRFHEIVRQDVARYNKHYTISNVLKLYLRDPHFRVILSLRLSQATMQKRGLGKIMHLFFRLIHHQNQHNAACDLSWKTEIGPGFYITHGWGLVISPRAQIGKNVTVFHGVTIGRKDANTHEGCVIYYPTIEDNVWIGPHAMILGVTVGMNSVIGGASVVTHDVMPNSVMVGNPARVLRQVEPETDESGCISSFCRTIGKRKKWHICRVIKVPSPK